METEGCGTSTQYLSSACLDVAVYVERPPCRLGAGGREQRETLSAGGA